MSIYQGNQKVANNYYIDNTVYCVPVGTIISYTSNIVPTGFLICDGSEVSKNTYSDLYKVVGDKFGTATDTTKFKLPDLRDKFVQGANDNVGTSKDAGLPNISGEVGYLKSANEGNYYQGINTSNGCFNQSANVITSPPAATTQFNGGTDSEGSTGLIRFNASDSNPIYGNSNTVQPPAVCLTYIIKATKLSDVPIETSNVIDDNSISEDRTWSANKIRNSTIPYVLIDTTKDINFNDYVETGYYTPNKSFSTGWFTHSILNAPTKGWLPAGGFALEVKTFDSTSSTKWFTQILYLYVGTDNNSAPIYSRTFFYDDTKTKFSPWKRIADIDDSIISSDETWSSNKINDTITSNKNARIILSMGRNSTEAETKTAKLVSLDGAYLYWSSQAGAHSYIFGIILYVYNKWTMIPIVKSSDDATTGISFSITDNILTMTRHASSSPTAGSVFALGSTLL